MAAERASITVTILNSLGLHARPAMAFVDAAVSCPCAIRLRRDDTEVDGKSIMQVMMLAATQGTTIEIVADGERAQESLAMLKALVESKFGEE